MRATGGFCTGAFETVTHVGTMVRAGVRSFSDPAEVSLDAGSRKDSLPKRRPGTSQNAPETLPARNSRGAGRLSWPRRPMV
ncbi:hypothetical protein [Streptomyces sp. CA-179760]|uniref:hypothetical protein n=1 Tax=Streptomyces sp. CA-179760 TaxID=3240054 RepID=UPI003D945519